MESDFELIERMRRGEQQAFDQFFETYAPRVAGFAARRSSLDDTTLQDVVQVTMINAIRGLQRFRGESGVFTWLCQICRNHLADIARKAKRQPQSRSFERLQEDGRLAEIEGLVDLRAPLDECCDDSTRAAVRRIINDMPATCAEILELRFGEDLSVPAIAKALHISESAAESRLSRARRAFRDRWKAGAGESAVQSG